MTVGTHQCLAAGRCECLCMHSEAKTFVGWSAVKKGKEAISLQEKHQGQIDKVQGYDCCGLKNWVK